MIELLMSLFSVAGSAGFGSILKLLSGALAGRRDHKLAVIAAMSKSDRNFQAIFKPGQQSKGSSVTRRILGMMLVGTICYIGIYAVQNPGVELITWIIPEAKQSWAMLWGFLKFPASKEITVVITLGHLAIMVINIGAMAVGFYFTPSGSR